MSSTVGFRAVVLLNEKMFSVDRSFDVWFEWEAKGAMTWKS